MAELPVSRDSTSSANNTFDFLFKVGSYQTGHLKHNRTSPSVNRHGDSKCQPQRHAGRSSFPQVSSFACTVLIQELG